jgi:hypothetical protein
VTDNGKGVTNRDRLISWAAKESTSIQHRYGHGSKKCLTKWNKNYHAPWYVKYRTKDKRGSSGSLFTFSGPYMGTKTRFDEDEVDDTTLYPSGLEWSIEFDKETLRDVSTPQQVFDTVKELLRTRYSKKYFDKLDFTITVNNEGALYKTESSKENRWKTFRECLDDEVASRTAVIKHSFTKEFNGVQIDYCEYYLTEDGRSGYKDTLQKEFPIYGGKNMRSTKMHTSLDGRIIELIQMTKFTNGKALHNNENGYIGFANFTGADYDKMPTPCTTKVSFRDSCPNFQQFVTLIREHREQDRCDCVFTTQQPIIKAQESVVKAVAPTKVQAPTKVKSKPQPPAPAPAPSAALVPASSATLSPSAAPSAKLVPAAPSVPTAPAPSVPTAPPAPTAKLVPTAPLVPAPGIALLLGTTTVQQDSGPTTPSAPEQPKAAKKGAIPKKVRTDVWNTYFSPNIAQHRCMCCKKTLISKDDYECGHVISEYNGGGMEISNFRPICRACNNSMATTNMEDFVVKHKYYIG